MIVAHNVINEGIVGAIGRVEFISHMEHTHVSTAFPDCLEDEAGKVIVEHQKEGVAYQRNVTGVLE
jgi:hypothetical protein